MSDKFAGLPDIATIQPDRLIKARVSEDRFAAEVLLPGLWYTDFDKKIGDKLTLWSIAKIFECIRYTVLPQGFGFYDRFKDANHAIFMGSTVYELSDKASHIFSRTHWGPNFPMHVKLDVIYAGNSSFTFATKVYNYTTGQHIMTAYLTFVYVEYDSRKAVRFPSWYQEMKKAQTFGAPLARLTTPVVPKDSFQFETRASYSDVDFNGHVNQAIFLKWCGDAGAEAARKGHYSGINRDIQVYTLQKVELRYIEEGYVNEHFIVKTWQESPGSLFLHFVITKRNKIIFVARFTYASFQEPTAFLASKL